MARGDILNPTVIGEKLRTRHKRFAKMYAKMKMSGEVDYHQLGLVFNPKEKLPEVKAKKLVKQKVIQEMATEEIMKLMEEKGITKDSVIDLEKEILEACKDENGKIADRNNALKISDKWSKRTDLDTEHKQITTTEQVDFTQILSEGENKETKKVSAKKEVKGLPDAEET